MAGSSMLEGLYETSVTDDLTDVSALLQEDGAKQDETT
jgi:hypothetical protein